LQQLQLKITLKINTTEGKSLHWAHPVEATMDEDVVNDGCATPPEPESFNRIKAPPVCVDVFLQKESMSTEFLRQWIFAEGTTFPDMDVAGKDCRDLSSTNSNLFPSFSSSSTKTPVSVISVGSNNSSGDSCISSDEIVEPTLNGDNTTNNAYTHPPLLNRDASERLNAKILQRKESRQGRSSQRWMSGSSSDKMNIIDAIGQSPAPKGETSNAMVATPNHDQVMRLVTGCVPILRTGKILFVSASRKAAWILPKGGWELDESMEESAIRECYEEAGCIGKLGPPLTSVQYETRKAKKRRVENGTISDKANKPPQLPSNLIDAWLEKSNESAEVSRNGNIVDGDRTLNADAVHDNLGKDNSGLQKSSDTVSRTASSPPQGALTSETMTHIRQLTQNHRVGGHQTDTESMSGGSTLSTSYTHVQMTLFPLYVQMIESDWPEKGRFRKAVNIDDAIEMMEERPELQAALIEVRDRKLHLVPDDVATTEAQL
jgi:NUDIX domain